MYFPNFKALLSSIFCLQVSELERNSSAQIGILNQHIANLEKNISQNSDTTADVYTELKIDVTNLTASVQHQLDTISKMEGPRVGIIV